MDQESKAEDQGESPDAETQEGGGRFVACTEFEASGYGKGYTVVKVTDTVTGNVRSDVVYPDEVYGQQNGPKEVAKRLANDMLTVYNKSMSPEQDDQSWRFDVSGEKEEG